MMKTINSPLLVFDVYDTLIDTQALVSIISDFVQNETFAKEFSLTWRTKQLEYTFRRALMDLYVPFDICTEQALIYTNEYFNNRLTENQLSELNIKYKTLPLFEDVIATLKNLSNRNLSLNILSNGTKSQLDQVLKHNKIEKYFKNIISVEVIKTYKPSTKVYQECITKLASQPLDLCLISSNPFDIIGAKNCGFKTIWINRSSKIFDPWDIKSDLTIKEFSNLDYIIDNL